MYNSQYYTCEQIDQRLLQGYLDDYNSQNDTNLTKEQFLTLLFNTLDRNSTVDNIVTQIGYYECDTAGATAAKAITVANYALFAGGSIKVKFLNRNTAGSATLNINSQGAKTLYYGGKAVSASNSWDNNEIVEIYYDGTNYYANNVEGNFRDGIFDISAYNLTEGQPTKYTTLSEALGTNGANVPAIFRKGGMQIKYVSASDNKYVQYRYTGTAVTGNPNPFLNTANWQGVDDTPTVGSEDPVKSGGVANIVSIPLLNGYVGKTGKVKPSTSQQHGYSELIPVNVNISYKARLRGASNADVIYFYDKGGNLVSSVAGTDSLADYEGTIPAGVAYVRFCCINKNQGGYYAYLLSGKEISLYDLYGGESFINNGYLGIDGSFNSSNAWKTTDYINVDGGSYVIIQNNIAPNAVALIVFYDADKEIVKVELCADTEVKSYQSSVIAPADAAYLRISTVTDWMYNSFVAVLKMKWATLESDNVISGDKTDFTNDGYIKADGSIVNTTYWKYTDYIPVTSDADYKISTYHQDGVVCPVVFYDKDKRIISKIVSTDDGMQTISGKCPVGTMYVRMCTSKTYNLNEAHYQFTISLIGIIETMADDSFSASLKYHNNFIGKPFNFSQKSIIFFGDSVTKGIASDPLRQIENGYAKVLHDTLGMGTLVNDAVSGSFICDPDNTETSILNKVLTDITQSSDYDFIVIAGGINDFWTGKPLGVITDNTYETFYGALNVMCSHLKTNAPNSNIIFLTPINCTRSDLSSAVASLDSYRNAIFEVATINGFNVIDTSVIGFPNDINDSAMRDALIADGVHPTENGHYMMGKNIAAILL